MAVELGTAYVNVVPSARGIEGGIARELAPMEGVARGVGARSGAALASGIVGKLGGIGRVAGLAAFVGVGVMAFKAAKSVEQANNTIIKTTGASGKALASLEKSFQNVAKRTPASFDQVSKAIAEVNQRTGLMGKPLEDLTLKIVTFNRISGQSVGIQALTRTMAGFNIPAAQMGEQLDKLFIAGQKTGLPLSQLLGILNISGPVLRQFGFDLAGSAALLGVLDKSGVPARIAIVGLRMAFARFSREGKEPKQALRDVIAEMQNLAKQGRAAEARKLGAQLFGARGIGLVDAALSGKLNLDALSKSLNLTGDGIMKTASKVSTLSSKMGVLKNNVMLALAAFATPIIDAATTALGKIVPIIQKVFDIFNLLPKPVRETLVLITTLAVLAGPLEKLVTLAHALMLNFVKLANTAKMAFVAVGTQLSYFVLGFQSAESAAAPITGLMGTLGGLARKAADGIVSLAQGTASGAKSLAQFVATGAKAVATTTAHTAALIAQKAAHLAVAAATRIAAAAQWLWDAAMDANPIGLIVIALAALAAAIYLAYRYIGPFRDAMDALGRGIASGFTAALDWIKALPGNIVGLLGSFGSLLVDAGKALLHGLMEGIEWGIALLIVQVIGLPVLIVTRLIPLAVQFVPIGARWIASLVIGLVQAIPRLLAFFITLPSRLIGAIGDASLWLLQVGFRMMVGFYTGEVRGFVLIFNFLRSLGARLITAVGDAGRWLWDAGIAAMKGLAEALVRGFLTVVGVLRSLPSLILATLLGARTWLRDTGAQAIQGLVDGIDFGSVIRLFARLPGEIIQAVGDIGQKFEDVGRSIVEGIARGIASAGGVVWDTLKDILVGAWDKAKSLIGMGSPAWTYIPMGRSIPEGIAKGIRDGRESVGRAAEEVMQEGIKRAKAAADRASATAGGKTITFRLSALQIPTAATGAAMAAPPKLPVDNPATQWYQKQKFVLGQIPPLVDQIVAAYGDLDTASDKDASYTAALASVTAEVKGQFGLTDAQAKLYAQTLLHTAAAEEAAAHSAKTLMGGQLDFLDAQARLTESLKGSNYNMDINTQAGRDNRRAFLDAANAALTYAQQQLAAKVPAQQVGAQVVSTANQLFLQARASGMARDAAAKYVATLLGIPPSKVTTIKTEKDLAQVLLQQYLDRANLVKDKSVTITARGQQAKNEASDVQRIINSITDKVVTVDVNTVFGTKTDFAAAAHARPGQSLSIEAHTTVTGTWVTGGSWHSLPTTGAAIAKVINRGLARSPITPVPRIEQADVGGMRGTLLAAGAAVASTVQKSLDAAGVTVAPHWEPSYIIGAMKELARLGTGDMATFGQTVQRAVAAADLALARVGLRTRTLAADQHALLVATNRVHAAEREVARTRALDDSAQKALQDAKTRLFLDTVNHASAAQLAADEFAVGAAKGRAAITTKALNNAEKALAKDRKDQASAAAKIAADNQALAEARQAEIEATAALRKMVAEHNALVAQLGVGFDKWLESLKLPPEYFDTIAQSAESMAQSVRGTFEQLTNVATGGMRGLASGVTLEHVEQWAAAIRQLEDMGLAPQLIAQFITAGPSSYREAQKLVAGGKPLIDNLNRTVGQIWAIEQATFQEAITRNPSIALPPWEQNPDLWAAAGIAPPGGGAQKASIVNNYNITGFMDLKTAEELADLQAWAATTAGSTP